MDDKHLWPAWFNGPNGETDIFSCAEDVPSGWTSGAEKRTVSGKTPVTPKPIEPATKNADLDAAGWPFDAALHAATQTKTQNSLWRMKVGVKRPNPKPGFPKPVLDL